VRSASAHFANNKDNDSEYVFISMEEAEAALRRERLEFDKERHELNSMLEKQRTQLEDLCRGRPRNNQGTVDDDEVITPELVDLDDVESIRKSKSSKSPTMMTSISSNTAPHEQAMQWADAEGGLMQQQEYQEQLRNIENQLRHVMGENERLMKRLQDQHRNYQGEKRELQERIMEERERLVHLREELNMERAYFETSRKLLENLLETEQKKVMALQEELFSRDMMGRQYSYGDGSMPEEFATFPNGSNQDARHPPPRNGKNKGPPRPRRGGISGLQMDLNDIRSPLYP
jgi:hypothetical protein